MIHEGSSLLIFFSPKGMDGALAIKLVGLLSTSKVWWAAHLVTMKKR